LPAQGFRALLWMHILAPQYDSPTGRGTEVATDPQIETTTHRLRYYEFTRSYQTGPIGEVGDSSAHMGLF
jgi:hypothetical protein